jgi:hypothetical protein
LYRTTNDPTDLERAERDRQYDPKAVRQWDEYAKGQPRRRESSDF